ncbi:Uma2 family endonuclease [Streptomyces albireticuli]|uniref:Uma2 family endonuclease n=1 Tax=Streptomyces albireticuli TaxID=1940 RepID=UPI0036BDCC79
MSARPHMYAADDPETALKYAIQHMRGHRVQIVEGVIEPMSPTWRHERAVTRIRRQIEPTTDKLGCVVGAGNVDLPGTPNWYIPDLAVVPEQLEDAEAVTPDKTLLVTEVTSESNGDTDRIVQRRRYAEYGAPLYLLVDRQERSCTLFSEPSDLGYTKSVGPHPFGTSITLPHPFDLDLDTSEF